MPHSKILITSDAQWFSATCFLARKDRSEEHTSELQSQSNLVCRLLLEKKKQTNTQEWRPAPSPPTNPAGAPSVSKDSKHIGLPGLITRTRSPSRRSTRGHSAAMSSSRA